MHLRNEHLFYSFLPLKRREGTAFGHIPTQVIIFQLPLLAVSIGKENLIVCLQLLEAELKVFSVSDEGFVVGQICM